MLIEFTLSTFLEAGTGGGDGFLFIKVLIAGCRGETAFVLLLCFCCVPGCCWSVADACLESIRAWITEFAIPATWSLETLTRVLGDPT